MASEAPRVRTHLGRPLLCRACGYNLTGLIRHGVCPECGADLTEEGSIFRRLIWRERVLAVLIAVGPPSVVLAMCVAVVEFSPTLDDAFTQAFADAGGPLIIAIPLIHGFGAFSCTRMRALRELGSHPRSGRLVATSIILMLLAVLLCWGLLVGMHV
jgi:hypothetical protein